MLAFVEAAELPIDGLEMDIHATKDDVLVISHGDDVSRTTNGNGRIPEYTLAELKQLDAGYHFTNDDGETFPFRDQGITIPTLEEVLDRFTDLWINVDIKQHEAHVVVLLCDLIRRHAAADRLCVGSFSDETVTQFRSACPDVVTLASITEISELFLLNRLRLTRFFDNGGHTMQIPPRRKQLGFEVDVVTSSFLETAHEYGMAVHIWTLNEEETIRQYVDMGVDGIITNYPDRALQVLNRLPAKSES